MRTYNNPLSNKKLRANGTINSTTSPELARVVSAWDHLPDDTIRGILERIDRAVMVGAKLAAHRSLAPPSTGTTSAAKCNFKTTSTP